MRKLTILAALGASLLGAGAAQAQSGVEAGTLECNVAGGVGLLIGSKKGMECRYRSADRKVNELYSGTVTKVGLDIGITGQSVIIWSVFAPTNSLRPGALAGTYTGVSGEASVGVGVGGNVLIGGSDKTITLQPVSVQAQTGVNLAVGIGSITLESMARPSSNRRR